MNHNPKWFSVITIENETMLIDTDGKVVGCVQWLDVMNDATDRQGRAFAKMVVNIGHPNEEEIRKKWLSRHE